MTNFVNDSETFTARPGLYRVWVPLRDDEGTPLVSIWIDPGLRAFKSWVEEKHLGLGIGTSFQPLRDAGSSTLADPENANSVCPARKALGG